MVMSQKQYGRKLILLASLGSFVSPTLMAEDFFADIDVDIDVEEVAEESSWLDLTGKIEQSIALGIEAPDAASFDRDERGLESVESSLFLQAEGKPTDNLGFRASADSSIEWVEWDQGDNTLEPQSLDVTVRDLYFDWTSEQGVWVRAGNQIVAWGEAEAIAVTDVVNPRDNTRPGQAELEDIRIQVPALFVSIPVAEQHLEFVLSDGSKGNEYGGAGDAFDPYAGSRSAYSFAEQDPDTRWEVAARFVSHFNGGDFALTAAEVNWDERSLVSVDSGTSTTLNFQAQRGQVLGVSGNLVRGSWLWKYDVAHHWDKPLQSSDTSLTQWNNYNQLLSALAMEYSGMTDWVFTLEADVIQTFDHSSDLTTDETAVGYMGRIRRTAWNEALTLQLSTIGLAGGNGVIVRTSADYDWTDSLSFGGDLVVYDASDSDDFLYAYRDQDVVKFRFDYHF